MIWLRPLRLRDISVAWDIANDPSVRAQSWDKGPPTRWEHLRWMLRWCLSRHRRAWLIGALVRASGRSIVGLVRLQASGGKVVIGIGLLTRYQRMGFGTDAIEEATMQALETWGLPVLAEIKVANLASIRAFTKAGYVFRSSRGVEPALMEFVP